MSAEFRKLPFEIHISRYSVHMSMCGLDHPMSLPWPYAVMDRHDHHRIVATATTYDGLQAALRLLESEGG